MYIDPSNETNKDFYSGIIAEPPKTMNRHRYLVSGFKGDSDKNYVSRNQLHNTANGCETFEIEKQIIAGLL